MANRTTIVLETDQRKHFIKNVVSYSFEQRQGIDKIVIKLNMGEKLFDANTVKAIHELENLNEIS